jgi:hypothetical protein
MSSPTVLRTPLRLWGYLPPLWYTTIFLFSHKVCLLRRLQDAWCTMGKNTKTKVNRKSWKPEELENGSACYGATTIATPTIVHRTQLSHHNTKEKFQVEYYVHTDPCSHLFLLIKRKPKYLYFSGGCYPITKTTIYTEDPIHIRVIKRHRTVKKNKTNYHPLLGLHERKL